MSAQSDIPLAVKAVKCGAHDFIEKPFDIEAIVDRVRAAIEGARPRVSDGNGDLNFYGCELLTPRERDVLLQITKGASNKEAGRSLGISPRTAEVHRARILKKLGARNAADVIRIALTKARTS